MYVGHNQLFMKYVYAYSMSLTVCNTVHFVQALQSLQEEYATLWEHYQQLHVKSREIIATLQEERDQKIAECENLSLQVSWNCLSMAFSRLV